MFATQLLNGISYSMLLFLLAAGLSVIFGMMDVLNLTHGSLYSLGGYLAFSLARLTGSFWLTLLLVPLIIGALGLLIETLFLRRLYQRGHLHQVLLTFGFVFVLVDLTSLIWENQVVKIAEPALLQGSISLDGGQYPLYRLFLVGFGLALAAALWLVQEKTRIGAILRAGVADKETVAALGININRVFTVVFAVGAALAGVAGVVAGPMLGMSPGEDLQKLVITLMVVVVGGLGTLSGSFFGALLVGLTETFGKVYFPAFDMFATYAIMAVVLILRPSGLFGKGG